MPIGYSYGPPPPADPNPTYTTQSVGGYGGSNYDTLSGSGSPSGGSGGGAGGGGSANYGAIISGGANVLGGALSGKGGKNAAKNSAPQIPSVFRGATGDATNLLRQYLKNGFPSYPGQLTAGQDPLQTQGFDYISQVLGAGRGSFDSALKTIMGAAEGGIQEGDIQLALDKTNPLFEFQKGRSLAQLRESQSQGGRFFGTGALNAESDLLRGLEAQRSADILPLALQMQGVRLGAAQSLPSFLAGQAGVGGAGVQAGGARRGIEQEGLNAQFQEFLRTRPEAAIPLLASLMGGTPFYNPVVPPNWQQTTGAGLTGLSQSPGFLQFLAQAYGQGGQGGQGQGGQPSQYGYLSSAPPPSGSSFYN